MDREQVAGQAVPEPEPDPLAGFQTFWKDHYKHFFKLLMAIGATEEDAEDTIGDVVEYMMGKKSWDGLEHPKAWVRTAILHTYYSRRERERERPERESKGCHIPPDSYIDPDLNFWENWEWVTRELNRLPKTQRDVVELTLLEFKPSEIAELLGKSRDAIRQNLAHARKRLKANLGKDYRIASGSRPAPTPRKEDSP